MTTARFASLLPASLLSLAVLAPSLSAATASSAPFGVISADLPVGKTGVAVPLISEDVVSAKVSGNSGNIVTLGAIANVGAKLTSGEKYYLEIASGALEGERFDIDVASTLSAANSTVVLDLSSSSYSTANAVTTNSLTDARAVIRPHVTLAKLATSFSPALVGNNNSALADTVIAMSNGALTFYYLRADNQTWREVGKTTDLRGLVIPPDVSVIVQLRSGAKKWTNTGVVRTNAFRKNLVAGLQGFATGFPIDLTPVQAAAFTDNSDPAAIRWVGSANAAQADSIKVFDSALNDFRSYQLSADGTSWVLPPDSANLSGSSLLKSPSMVVISRVNADPGYVIAPPFAL